MDTTRSYALKMDEEDPLKRMRERFIIPVHSGQEQTYLLGNSLGLQPRRAGQRMQQVLDTWGSYGVEGFFMGEDPWMAYHDHLAGPLSRIVGALPHEVTVMNQLSVNLHLMMVSFYNPQGRRNKILCEKKAFPSDQYMLETYVKHIGLDPEDVIVEVGPPEGADLIRQEDIYTAIEEHKDELALVFWGGLNYYTGQVFDMAGIVDRVKVSGLREKGVKVGFDLAHAAGNIRLDLHAWDVDFACWCSYKYLNSGPGAVGGVFIHERFHGDASIDRLAGWWGHDKQTRFLMEKGFRPIRSAEGWQLSTPSILLYACHLAALETMEEAGWEHMLAKQEKMKSYLWYLMGELNRTGDAVRILTPERERGCQISMFMLRDGKRIYDGLMRQGVIVDWREPNVIRLAPVPLYNTFRDIHRFYESIRQMI
jgi:kynureninase